MDDETTVEVVVVVADVVRGKPRNKPKPRAGIFCQLTIVSRRDITLLIVSRAAALLATLCATYLPSDVFAARHTSNRGGSRQLLVLVIVLSTRFVFLRNSICLGFEPKTVGAEKSFEARGVACDQ